MANNGELRLQHEFLSPAQVCELLPGINPHTLAMWRYRGRGPKFHKMGRVVLYALDELNEWIENGA
ncbi:MAG: helix-turn-helix transcriptional regulator [Microbacterium sp.]|uniref:helix-turn-helix transcriptional regulator n=1 Tax=Microbacterium sp. TaxID=51671 RepID=UPI003F809EEC